MKVLGKIVLAQLLILICVSASAQTYETTTNRWVIESNDRIVWHINNKLPHQDHIEMSGQKISAILRYEVAADGSFVLNRTLVWPMLRTIPNDTHASLKRSFKNDILSAININGKLLEPEKVQSIMLNGVMTVRSSFNKGINITRSLFPSTKVPAYCENYTIKNKTSKNVTIEIPAFSSILNTDPLKGVDGSYIIEIKATRNGSFNLGNGDSLNFGVVYCAHKVGEDILNIDVEKEHVARLELLKEWQEKLVLETPSKTLNTAFAFAKIRASESIFETKGGFMHGPGGGAYYAAIWANDQAEYIGPFFPFLGYDIGNDASLNAYLHFARFINKDYKPIPSSIIAEGIDIWNGAGDRGDQAMIAYGAARFALESGDKVVAEKLWPLVEWCLEYLNRKVNSNGVVTSDSDELEGRFPSGDANLCTSSLYYDALISATYLGKELGKPNKLLADYSTRAANLRKAIDSFFGSKVEGFDTYRYYEGNDVLRAWICIPLTVNIFDRKQGTINALFSPRLWTADGLATQAGDSTFWDRSTLYALRGVFATGEKEKALKFLEYYSNRRLLGEHVPYPIEAYPEGGQRHLSAESGLYCRVYTEGLFGIRPIGLTTFSLTPQLPKEWNTMSLRNIQAFGSNFDITISRVKSKIKVKIVSSGLVVNERTINEGDTMIVKLRN